MTSMLRGTRRHTVQNTILTATLTAILTGTLTGTLTGAPTALPNGDRALVTARMYRRAPARLLALPPARPPRNRSYELP